MTPTTEENQFPQGLKCVRENPISGCFDHKILRIVDEQITACGHKT
jgi:hypothetical protein